jgi:hypothetical protein
MKPFDAKKSAQVVMHTYTLCEEEEERRRVFWDENQRLVYAPAGVKRRKRLNHQIFDKIWFLLEFETEEERDAFIPAAPKLDWITYHMEDQEFYNRWTGGGE